MKTTIVLFVIGCLIAPQANSQKLKSEKVPPGVKSAFTQHFPNAKKVKWSQEAEHEYEAEFINGQQEQSSNFDENGKWLETETEIEVDELPEAVSSAIGKQFSGARIKEPETAETPEAGLVYEVELKFEGATYEVRCSRAGEILSKEEKTGKHD